MRWIVVPLLIGLGVGQRLGGPPDLTALDGEAQKALLHELVRSNVAGVNCTDFQTTPSQWNFIVTTADALAEVMGLSVGTYDAKFYGPAFDALDANPDFCSEEGPRIGPLIERMVELGGVVDKYKYRG